MNDNSTQNIDGMTPKDAAAFWDARLRSPDCSEADRQAHRQWQASDPSHAGAFRDLQGMISALPAAAHHAEIESLRSGARDWFEQQGKGVKVKNSWIVVGGAIAASIALFLAMPTWLGPKAMPGPANSQIAQASFSTELGQRSTVPLADGSAMILNTASEADVRYDSNHRNIALVRGEAHFEVNHDASRPFRVAAGDYLVTAIGTAFDVRVEKAGNVQVTVTDGIVSIARAGDPEGEFATTLAKGQRLRTSATGAAIRQAMDLDSASAWRAGRAVFDDIPLSLAAEEMNRYSEIKLVIADRDLAGTRISGMFETGDQASFVEALEQYFGVSAEQNGNREIRLSQSGN